MKGSTVVFSFLALTEYSLVSGLDPGSYGTGQDPSTKEGYKTAYARAKAAREMAFAKKAEQDGAVAPQEEIMQQDYQVKISPFKNLYYFSYLQERHTITVEPRSQTCFFIEDLEVGYVISLHYTVLSIKSGKQMDISFQLKDSTKKMVVFHVRKKEEVVSNHTVTTAGDYEMCFINRYSLMESKKIMWELDIVGEEEEIDTENIYLAVNQTLEQYTEQARIMRLGIVKIRTKMSKVRSQQWWLSSKATKGEERLLSMNQMIDTWSMAYSLMVIIVGIIQTVFLRRLFNIKPVSGNMKMRT